MKSRLPAFTIMELLVSMLISALLLGMSWSIYQYLQQYQKSLETKASELNQLKQVEYLLKKEISKCEAAELASGSALIIYGLSDTTRYDLSPNVLYRTRGLQADSLEVGGAFETRKNSNSVYVHLTNGQDLSSFLLDWKPSSATLVNSP